MSGFDLTDLAVRLLAESHEENPRLLADKLINAIGIGDMESAARQMAPDFLYNVATHYGDRIIERERQLALMVEHGTFPEDPHRDEAGPSRCDAQSSLAGPSRWDTVGLGLHGIHATRQHVPTDDGGEWKRLGELVRDEVLAVVAYRRDQAVAIAAKADRWQQLHDLMVEHSAERVADLSEDLVREVLG